MGWADAAVFGCMVRGCELEEEGAAGMSEQDLSKFSRVHFGPDMRVRLGSARRSLKTWLRLRSLSALQLIGQFCARSWVIAAVAHRSGVVVVREAEM
eukprot:1942157-Rhodomonas_salina.1